MKVMITLKLNTCSVTIPCENIKIHMFNVKLKKLQNGKFTSIRPNNRQTPLCGGKSSTIKFRMHIFLEIAELYPDLICDHCLNKINKMMNNNQKAERKTSDFKN